MKKICVIGSLNMDLVMSVDKFPQIGETVKGNKFDVFSGGKGGNQCVALAKLGADVTFCGKVGFDSYGDKYIELFNEYKIDNKVQVEKNISTGIAVIEVDSAAQNKITVIDGANAKVDKKYILDNISFIMENDIFLLQFEIPIDTVCFLVKILHESGKTVILDPAPYYEFPEEYYQYIDYITPNETELQQLTTSTENLRQAAFELLNKGIRNVILKIGKQGCYFINKQTEIRIPAFKVDAIDSTAAGDSFNAGFAFGLSIDNEIRESLLIANATAALSTTSCGAQVAMPSFNQVKQLIESQSI